MITQNIEKCLWLSVVLFVTYLFLGSFLVSNDIIELFYLFILYSFMFAVKIVNRKQ